MILHLGTTTLDLPDRFQEGDICDVASAALLTSIKLKRIKWRLEQRIKKGGATVEEIQQLALNLSAEFVFTASDPGDSDDADAPQDDPLLAEAKSLARSTIIAALAKDGITVEPPNFDTHIAALADTPEFRERARKRLEAKLNAANASIERLEKV